MSNSLPPESGAVNTAHPTIKSPTPNPFRTERAARKALCRWMDKGYGDRDWYEDYESGHDPSLYEDGIKEVFVATFCDRDGINRRIVRDSLVEMTDAVCPKWKGAHRT